MLPIYIICHADCKPSSYLCHFFTKKNIPFEKINAIHNKLSTIDLTTAAGFVFMGGPYSVNDDLPWLADEIKFIQQAVEKDIPIMAVCFGAQLISKALNAEVVAAENMELGWHNVTVDASQLTDLHHLNLDKSFEVFEWHEEVYRMPDGAIPIFSGFNLENQGYLYGKILAMQFHLEVTEHMIFEWLERYKDCLPEPCISVQSPEQLAVRLNERLENLHTHADIIYDWWLKIVSH